MYGKVGRQIAAAGSINPLRTDRDGNLVVASYGAKYADLVAAGRVFSCASHAATAVTAGAATTWTGLGVANPAGSAVDLVMLEFGVAQHASADAAAALGLMVNDTTGFVQDTNVPPMAALRGSTITSAAVTDAGATIAANSQILRLFGYAGTVATTAPALEPGIVVPLDGSIILQPGNALMTYSSAAVSAAFFFHFVWAEMER